MFRFLLRQNALSLALKVLSPLSLIALMDLPLALRIGIGLAILATSAPVREWERERLTDLEDERVATLVRTSDDNDFILFLRPFGADAELPLMDDGEGSQTHFETYILWCAERMARVVKISSDMRIVGGVGGILCADDEWKGVFANLAARARAIIQIPGNTPGVIEELEELRAQRLLERCIFVLPRRDRHPEYWEAAEEGFQGVGLSLPETETQGLILMRFDSDGGVIRATAIEGEVPGVTLTDMIADIFAEASDQRWRRWWIVRRSHRITPFFTLPAILVGVLVLTVLLGLALM